MGAPIGDGLDAANDQPAKTLTKNTTDFIARCMVAASNDAGLCVLVVVVAFQVVSLVLSGALQ
jgi:hypothetical protein